MMVGAAFILLKVGYRRRRTAEQAEIRLAGLPIILRILRSAGGNSRRARVVVVSGSGFRGIWLIRPKLFVLLSSSQS
jgi:hypothetical protein